MDQIEKSLTEGELLKNRQRLAHCDQARLNVKSAHHIIETLREELSRLIKIKEKRLDTEESQRHAQNEFTERSIELRMNEALLEELESSLERDESERALAPLREKLIEGEPCPLCGSLHHELGRLQTSTRSMASTVNQNR